MSNKEIEFSNKYWEEAEKIEEMSIKLDFYNMLSTNINNEEQENIKKALKFCEEYHYEHIYADPTYYFETIKDAVKADCKQTGETYNENDAINICNDFFDDYKRDAEQVGFYFQLYEKYRQNLEILNTNQYFLKILLSNENIVYKESIDLLCIQISLIQNYVETQIIKLMQEILIDYFKVDYKVTFPLKPFIEIIDNFNVFLSKQGYKVTLSKSLKLPKEKTKNFIKNLVPLYSNPQKQINKVIEYSNISIGIEENNGK